MEKEHKPGKFLLFLHRAFESHNPKDPLSLSVDIFYILIILLSITFTCLEVTHVWKQHEEIFKIFEYIMIGFFFLEWIVCFFVVDVSYPQLPFIKRKLKWILSVESIVDIICLTVFVLVVVLEPRFREIAYLEFLSLLKLVRLYKLFKYRRFLIANKKVETKKEGDSD